MRIKEINVMEEYTRVYREQKFTMRWLELQCLFVIAMAVLFAYIAVGIGDFASDRVDTRLLTKTDYKLLSSSIVYCFGVISITS